MPEVELKRALGLPLLVLYGLGTTIGAGIFALLGKVAGEAGMATPLAFLLAAALAGLSAFSFAELAGRLPFSAGEAVYVREGFGSDLLARLVGLAVAAAGIVSAAAIAKASVGYIAVFLPVPGLATVVVVILLLGLIAAWGIAESVTLAALFTLIEAGCLVFVILSLGDNLAETGPALAALEWNGALWTGVLAGGFLAFYAFLGFEDMVNVAEEVRDVARVMGRAIALTLVLTTLIYVALALVAVLEMAPAELAASGAPLADLYRLGTGRDPGFIALISIFAILNGALIQIIMASRVVYGLARRGLLPAGLAQVHPGRRTPLRATALVVGVVLVLALGFPIEGLARLTSGLTLAIFALVNLALWRLKRRGPPPAGVFVVPWALPVLGAVVSLGFLALALVEALGPGTDG